jgi:hypothetical protein
MSTFERQQPFWKRTPASNGGVYTTNGYSQHAGPVTSQMSGHKPSLSRMLSRTKRFRVPCTYHQARFHRARCSLLSSEIGYRADIGRGMTIASGYWYNSLTKPNVLAKLKREYIQDRLMERV